jgi:tRNA pseudouridine32 synthase/23S rRNA pseudouridine746 synthase
VTIIRVKSPSQGYTEGVIPFSTIVEPAEAPARFPSPFDRAAIHPLARRAAAETMTLLDAGLGDAWELGQVGGGKMFGVLVVAASDGSLGYLRAFSGMLKGQWTIAGWAPPTFDARARDVIWIPGEAALAALSHDAARTAMSRELLPAIQGTYSFANARGEVRALHELFAPAQPPAGAGDCAAPKLLAEAYAKGLRPLALAEFWWGAPPRSGDRRSGSFYAACQGKCPPLLAHMLSGLPADPPPQYGSAALAPHEPTVVYEDAHVVVVDKPSGMLSVPGLSQKDCVSNRLRARYPEATGQLVVHRLDLDTSGLLIAAKDPQTFSALQRLFSQRAIAKRYVAWLDGVLIGERGVVDLPIRMDVEDRPRQIHDPVHGKSAMTEWAVLERGNDRTKLALVPLTGRTHQLRVHASHPLGLDAPIVGDRLYGREAPEHGERLLLHAESVAFTHPVTGVSIQLSRPAPF